MSAYGSDARAKGQRIQELQEQISDMSAGIGKTAARPVTDLTVGKMYFDTDLALPIWYTGSEWINAAGTTV